MKLDFRKSLVTRTGDAIKDSTFERSVVNRAIALSKGVGLRLLSDVARVLDENKVTFSDIVQMQGEDYTFATFFAGLLDGPKQKDDGELKAKDLLVRRRLADKIFGAKEPISLTLKEEIPLLEKLTEQAYNSGMATAVIVGQALEFLEEREDAPAEEIKY